jgi:hypothetical protein
VTRYCSPIAAISLLARFWRLSWRDRALLTEALVFLTAACVGMRLVPFRRLAPYLGVVTTDAPPAGGAGGGQPTRVGRAVQAVSRRVPWRTQCLTEAMAAQWMLRRRGLPGVLHVGVHKEGDTMTAHAWTSCGNENVVGGAGAERFTPLTAFGPRT